MPTLPLAAEFAPFTLADGFRRWYGEVLDLWLARTETPSELVLERPGAALRYYGEAGNHPPLLIIPAPIKKPYIWDLTPSVSVVRRCLEASLRVYCLEWREAPPEDPNRGIAVYADKLIMDCVDAIGEPVVLAGHSLGGTFAAIFASLYAEHARALLLLEAPLSFAADTGAIAALIRIVPSTPALRDASDYPGTLLNALSLAASPESFFWWRWRDKLASTADAMAYRTHLLVERWTLDEYAMPGELFADVVDLYRNDRFMQGTLEIAGKVAAARQVTAPLLAVVDPESDVVPPSSVVPFLDVLPERDWTLLHYEGDTGVALRHVGVLVGRNAHRLLWPKILDWVKAKAG
ncbi:MAG TPA: alpha/beta fold hydrolase [Methyloceanibacter sp.]|jgi:polyhydroxyalkanoate synthase|nr:alpha/beta fold hydrolase [Methyloceanibacter sp.]